MDPYADHTPRHNPENRTKAKLCDNKLKKTHTQGCAKIVTCAIRKGMGTQSTSQPPIFTETICCPVFTNPECYHGQMGTNNYSQHTVSF